MKNQSYSRSVSGKVIPLIIIVFSLQGCTPPQTVRGLTSKTIEVQETLAQQQIASLDAYREFSIQAEEHANTLVSQLRVSQKTLSRVAIQNVRTSAENMKLNVLKRFDEKAWELLTVEFEKTLDANYWKPIKANIKVITDKWNKLKVESAAKPDDKIIEAKIAQLNVFIQYVSRLALEKERELRIKIARDLKDARMEVSTHIDARVQGFLDEHEDIEDNNSLSSIVTSGEGESMPTVEAKNRASYEEVRKSIDAMKTELNQLNASQLDALKAIQRYLNMPSFVQLIFAGMKERITQKLSDAGKSLQSVVDSKLSNFALKAEKSLSSIQTDLEGYVTKIIEGKKSDISTAVGAAKGNFDTEIGGNPDIQ